MIKGYKRCAGYKRKSYSKLYASSLLHFFPGVKDYYTGNITNYYLLITH